MRWIALIAVMTLAGCQTGQYVTHEELARAMEWPPTTSPASSADRRRQIDELVKEALCAPTTNAAAAAALGAADVSTGRLRDVLAGIDRAREICADNIANADTVAYKCVRLVRRGEGPAATQLDMAQGRLQTTNRQLDIVIDGDGFLTARGPDGKTLYTRAGNLFVDHAGRLVFGVGDGHELAPAIVLPAAAQDVIIKPEGGVEAMAAGHKRVVGQIVLARFLNPEALKPQPSGFFTATEASGPPVTAKPGQNGAGLLLQGSLEGSNTDLTREMLRLCFLSEWREAIMHAVGR